MHVLYYKIPLSYYIFNSDSLVNISLANICTIFLNISKNKYLNTIKNKLFPAPDLFP